VGCAEGRAMALGCWSTGGPCRRPMGCWSGEMGSFLGRNCSGNKTEKGKVERIRRWVVMGPSMNEHCLVTVPTITGVEAPSLLIMSHWVHLGLRWS
jgi:hypothetical protein